MRHLEDHQSILLRNLIVVVLSILRTCHGSWDGEFRHHADSEEVELEEDGWPLLPG
jgi:hypothetical protein